MTAKDIKKYNLICTIASAEADLKLVGYFTELSGIDFTTAFEVWEYKMGLCQNELGKPEVALSLEERVFAMFMNTSETKTRQLFLESLPLFKLVYGTSLTSATGCNLAFLTGLILSSKINEADEALRCMKSNITGDFGERMRAVFESVINTYCAKAGVKKAELNKKQKTLLLDYIGKIKGSNKAVLTQRIKEL